MQFKEALTQFNQWRGLKVGKGTLTGYDLSLRYFCMFTRNPDIEQIKVGHILEWLHYLREMGFDIMTIEKKVIALRKFLEFFRRQGFGVLDPWLVPLPPKKFKMPRVASLEDYKKLLSAIPEKSEYYYHIRNRAIVKMLWDSGARIGELISLNMPDLDLDRYRAVIRTEKT
ncbi:MAG: site-specific integrase, partial [Dehalococcoidia bacterium]